MSHKIRILQITPETFPPILVIEPNPPLGIVHPEKGAGKDGWPFKVRNPFQGQTKHPGHMLPAGPLIKPKSLYLNSVSRCVCSLPRPVASGGVVFFTHGFERENAQGCRLGLWEGRTMTVRRTAWLVRACVRAPRLGGRGLRDLRGPWSPGCATLGRGGLPEAPAAPHAVPPPPGPRQECLARLFSPCGPVQSVESREKPELADSPKEPKSKFFHPTPTPVSAGAVGCSPGGAAGCGQGSLPTPLRLPCIRRVLQLLVPLSHRPAESPETILLAALKGLPELPAAPPDVPSS